MMHTTSSSLGADDRLCDCSIELVESVELAGKRLGGGYVRPARHTAPRMRRVAPSYGELLNRRHISSRGLPALSDYRETVV